MRQSLFLLLLVLAGTHSAKGFTCSEPGAAGSSVPEGYLFSGANLKNVTYGKCDVTCKYKNDGGEEWSFTQHIDTKSSRKSCKFTKLNLLAKDCKSGSVEDCVVSFYSKPE